MNRKQALRVLKRLLPLFSEESDVHKALLVAIANIYSNLNKGETDES